MLARAAYPSADRSPGSARRSPSKLACRETRAGPPSRRQPSAGRRRTAPAAAARDDLLAARGELALHPLLRRGLQLGHQCAPEARRSREAAPPGRTRSAPPAASCAIDATAPLIAVAQQALERFEQRQIRFGARPAARNSGRAQCGTAGRWPPAPRGNLRPASSCRCPARPRHTAASRARRRRLESRAQFRPLLLASDVAARRAGERRTRPLARAPPVTAFGAAPLRPPPRRGRRRASFSSIRRISASSAAGIAGFDRDGGVALRQ